MTKFPMNQNTPKGQTHTIMETPIWTERLISYWVTLTLIWFTMLIVAGLLSAYKIPAGIGCIFYTSFPLLIAVFVDEVFTQQFSMQAWEISKKDDHISIRGIPIPKIREYIEWQRSTRKKHMIYIGVTHILLTIVSNDFDYTSNMILPFVAAIIISVLVRTWLGFRKFGFTRSDFSNVSSFKKTI